MNGTTRFLLVMLTFAVALVAFGILIEICFSLFR